MSAGAKQPAALTRLRRLALALPEAHEQAAWGEPTFRVRGKLFAMYASATNHHGAGRHAVWMKAAPGNQEAMVRHAPNRFFVPPYVGPSGWIGVYLDRGCDWRELRILLAEAWRLIAPKRLVTATEAAGTPSTAAITAETRARKGTARRPPAATSPERPRPRSPRRAR